MTSLIRLGIVGAAGLLLLVLGACGGEPLPVDDGSVASLDAASLPDGTEVVDLDSPSAATAEQVVVALVREGIEAEVPARGEANALAIDPATVAGLIDTVVSAAASDGGRLAVLVFDEPASALVFAATDPTVLDVGRDSISVDSFFSGNLVGYYAADKASRDRDSFLNALSSLAGS